MLTYQWDNLCISLHPLIGKLWNINNYNALNSLTLDQVFEECHHHRRKNSYLIYVIVYNYSLSESKEPINLSINTFEM